MNWSLRQLAAGAQTLRIFTALVCSLAVTSAVAGPMAWQALEYRRDEAALVAPTEPVDDASDASSAATERVGSGSRAGDGGTPATPASPAATGSTTSVASTVASSPAFAAGSAASSTTIGSGALGAQVSVPGGPVSNATPPTSAARIVADDPVTPPPTVTGPGSTTPATDPTVTTPTTATTTATTDLLDEFNPRPPCDDAAYELRVDAVPDCEPARP